MASKSNGMETWSDWARAPPSGTAWENFLKNIYNPEEKSFLGRTAKRWGILFLFYAVFYACLALLVFICFKGLDCFLDDKIPKWKLDQSLIGTSPGLSYRPLPDGDRYESTVKIGSDKVPEQLKEFFEPYDFSSQTECVASDNYGYPDHPCIFIKLNKIYDWIPEMYDKASLPNLTHDTQDLIEHVQSLEDEEAKQIWITCWTDDKNVTLDYPWTRGLAPKYYPYRNEDRYLQPVVAVKVNFLENKTTVTVHCRALAKNIQYRVSVKEPLGYTRILLEKSKESSEEKPTE